MKVVQMDAYLVASMVEKKVSWQADERVAEKAV